MANSPETYDPSRMITVRTAMGEDVGYILRLGRTVFHQYGPYEEMLRHWFELDTTLTLLASMGGDPVGFAMLGRLGRQDGLPSVSELLAIAVEPVKWRRGVGDCLMKEVERQAKKIDLKTLVLHTATDNLCGQRLFAKWDFVPCEIKTHFYPAGHHAVMMYKNMDEPRYPSSLSAP